MSEQKSKQKFKIDGKAIVYDGLESSRHKDLLDILAKMSVADDTVVATYRANIANADISDAEIQAAFEEAKRIRRDRKNKSKTDAPLDKSTNLSAAPSGAFEASASVNLGASQVGAAPAAPAAAEVKQKLTLTYNGKQFVYDGYPSKRENALMELVLKQGDVSNDALYQAYRENFPDTTHSSDYVAALMTEARRAKQQKDDAKRAAKNGAHTASSEAGTTSAGPATGSAATNPVTGAGNAAVDELASMTPSEKAVIHDFINSVLQSSNPSAAVAAANSGATPRQSVSGAAGVAPTASSNGAATNVDLSATNPSLAESQVDNGPKIAVYCQEENATTANKIVYASRNVRFVDFVAMVEKKLGHKAVLSFFEGDDKIEIDDDDVLSMFFDSQTPGRKLRITCSPPETRRVVKEDILTAEASTAKPPAKTGGDKAVVALSTAAVTAPPSTTAKPSQFNSSGVLSIGEKFVYTGHTAAVYCCAFSADGEKFCTASRDRSVRVWNTANGTCTTMRGGHNGFVLSCDFAPNGNFIVSSADDCSIKVWNVSSGSKALSLKGHDDKVYCVQYNSSGGYIVSGSCDRTVRVWNADSGARQVTLKGHDLAVFSCCFSNTDVGRFVASGSDDRLVKVWDWREGREVKNFIGHTGTVWSVQFSHNDKFLVSASMDHELKLWDVASSTCTATMTGHMTPIHHAIFSSNDKYLLSCARDHCVIVWDVETGKRLENIQGHRNTVYHLALHGNKLLTCSLDDTIKLWSFDEVSK